MQCGQIIWLFIPPIISYSSVLRRYTEPACPEPVEWAEVYYTGRMRKGLRNLLFFLIVLVIVTFQIAMLIGSPLFLLTSRAVLAQKNAVRLILKNEKTSEDIVYIKQFLAITRRQTYRLANLVNKLSFIIPINSVVESANILESFSTKIPRLFGDGKDANFVLLFLNNYELRPGGGFIGSLGFITFKNYSMTSFEVQDVYEIDGQITSHTEPHFAVRKYLRQPNEFLRDSNFSPDFSVNAQKAIRHLSSVPSYKKPYTAVIGITTSAFEELLRLTGPIELADYSTTITSSNFFSTTQRKIEDDFFPGSKQKRSILQSLGNVMRQRIESIPPLNIFEYLYKTVRTKHMVFFSPNKQLQNLFLVAGAAGNQVSTYENWLLPVDANVGVNKMDALVRKSMELRIIQGGKNVEHIFKSTYTNSITFDATEKEVYKNYFQIYVPKAAIFKKALLNGVDVSNQILVANDTGNTVFAIYFETPPASSSIISITYDLPYNSRMKQLHFQKQIGLKPTPLTIIYNGDATKVEQRLLNSDEVFIF